MLQPVTDWTMPLPDLMVTVSSAVYLSYPVTKGNIGDFFIVLNDSAR